ncbi:glycosyltransferase [Ruoffia sp. FAM 24228]|uniref:glycosyltransferase n=1 Tax=Ruoffia sp. FAM 24228 TaxID=3259517 RepID=UPI00388561EC
MKITHIALCGPVTDGLSYQDNLLPKYHKENGFEVSMITSKFIWSKKGKIVKDKRNEYINEYGIKTIRLDTKREAKFSNKFKKYINLFEAIENEEPNVLFIHGVQFLDIAIIKRYLDTHRNILVYVDNHADFSNSASNWLSKNILHKIIWRYCAQLIEPYTKKFYGVLPARVDFLVDIYKVPQQKVELLLLGAEDDKVKKALNKRNIRQIRENHSIEEDDFLIVTGGKIDDAKKQTLLLMDAVRQINNPRIKLIIFGSVAEELREQVVKLIDDKKIQYIGWINGEESYKYFAASDLVVFPGRHSVYWEQVVAIGIPMIVKYWEGTTHIDIGGNCLYLEKDSKIEIQEKIEYLLNYPNKHAEMKSIAQSSGKKEFLYSRISAKSIKYIE